MVNTLAPTVTMQLPIRGDSEKGAVAKAIREVPRKREAKMAKPRIPTRVPSALLPVLFLSVSTAPAQNANATEPGAAKRSFAVEADAAAYALRGYSGIGRVTFRNGLNVALGTGRYNVPGFILRGDGNYDAAKWKATAESIQVFRIGYRFGGAMKSGAVVDAIVINQNWRLRAGNVAGETKFKQIGAGISGGYYIHVGKHFYIYPTASLTRNTVYSGTTRLGSLDYRVRPTQFNGSVHVGWEWGI